MCEVWCLTLRWSGIMSGREACPRSMPSHGAIGFVWNAILWKSVNENASISYDYAGLRSTAQLFNCTGNKPVDFSCPYHNNIKQQWSVCKHVFPTARSMCQKYIPDLHIHWFLLMGWLFHVPGVIEYGKNKILSNHRHFKPQYLSVTSMHTRLRKNIVLMHEGGAVEQPILLYVAWHCQGDRITELMYRLSKKRSKKHGSAMKKWIIFAPLEP